MKTYLLEVKTYNSIDKTEEEYIEIFNTFERAKSYGLEFLDQELESYCKYLNKPIQQALKEEKIDYDFKIIEEDINYAENFKQKLEFHEEIEELLIYEPTHKEFILDYTGEITNICIRYLPNQKETKGRNCLYLKSNDLLPNAGTKFKVGNLVKYNNSIKENSPIDDLKKIIKKEIRDNYDLINSTAIRDYCRKIKYQFNTEELAVLVYRNKTMDIFEKISKYQDLIDNYPDMEVIERINCEHYDSVKVMLKNEIERNKKTYEDFVKKDENSVYTWDEYNRTTKEYSRSYEIINNLKKTYEETYKSVKDYINEFDDTISFIITKKFFGENERLIYAHYSVIDKTPKLVKIYDKKDDFLDIDNIFVYMPTPFKKGDILISENPSRCNYGDNGEIFVLEYLRTWQPNIKEYLAKGNCDSSDMSGSGYYLYDNKAQIILEDKWDYDSFEYYEGNIEGNNRILKAISSYLKGEIGMELLIHAYDVFKIESINKTMPDFYTEEGLKKAGFTDIDIQNEKNN